MGAVVDKHGEALEVDARVMVDGGLIGTVAAVDQEDGQVMVDIDGDEDVQEYSCNSTGWVAPEIESLGDGINQAMRAAKGAAELMGAETFYIRVDVHGTDDREGADRELRRVIDSGEAFNGVHEALDVTVEIEDRSILGPPRVPSSPKNPYAAEAARLLETSIEKRSEYVLRRAETFATLAVAYEQRQTRLALGEYLGDDSHVDGIKQAVREVAGELNVGLGRS